jgi:hypothetical protein
MGKRLLESGGVRLLESGGTRLLEGFLDLYDGVSMVIEAAFAAGSGFAVWDTGTWGTAIWGPDEVWTDITSWVRHQEGVQIGRAFSRELEGWNAGSCSFALDNSDGRFSPSNLSGPYVDGGLTQVRPWTPIRIRAAYGGVEYPLFRGYALSWTESWVRGADLAITKVECVDELAALARFDGYEQPAVGAGERFGPRLHRILNNAGHQGNRAIDVGEFTFQATTLAANTVTELKLVADSEGGALWVDADGTIVGVGQGGLLGKTPVVTFGDGPGELRYRDVISAYDGDLVANVVAFARTGGTVNIAADSDSRALLRGDKRYTRTDLVCETDGQVQGLADLYLHRHKNPEERFVALIVTPRSDPTTLWPQVLGRKPLDLITVKRTPPGGDLISRDCFIAGVRHRFDANSWTTTFPLVSATAYSPLGTWDAATWDTTLWGPG